MSHWQSKTKIDRADILFSRFIRKRDGWRCQYKFKCTGVINYEQIGDTGSLTTSHFEKRRKRTVRFDMENCDAACRKCHQYVEDTPEGAERLRQWKLKQLGPKKYRELIIRANLPGRGSDKKMELLFVKALIKEHEENK